MKRSTMVLMGAVMMTGLLVTGCKKDGGPDEAAPVGVTNEEQAMIYFAKNDEFVANDEQTFADQSIQTFDYGTFGKIDAAITPLRWGRIVSSVTRTVTTTVQPGDTIAIAVVDKNITGTLKIRGLNQNGDTVNIDKPFNDVSKRNIIFKRVNRNTEKYWLNWVPVATSLVDGGTASPNNQIDITKLVLYTSTTDTITITDPNGYYLRYRWLNLFKGGRKDVPEFIAGQALKLQVTVVSSSPDTDFVALRFGVDGTNHKRVRLALVSETNNGNGTYTRVFEIARTAPQFMHFHRGWFHMGVDAVTRATLMDDAAPYSVSWWGVPYRVF